MLNEYIKDVRQAIHPREKMQEPRRQSRFTYVDGPVFFLGLQIVRAMQDAGHPAKISECYRSPEHQEQLFERGTSQNREWQSPHQYLEAVDIIHPFLGRNVSQDYWETLNACTEIVAERYGVSFQTGYDWNTDPAHIEAKDWRSVANRMASQHGNHMRPPNPDELWQRFRDLLPKVAKQHMKSIAYTTRMK